MNYNLILEDHCLFSTNLFLILKLTFDLGECLNQKIVFSHILMLYQIMNKITLKMLCILVHNLSKFKCLCSVLRAHFHARYIVVVSCSNAIANAALKTV